MDAAVLAVAVGVVNTLALIGGGFYFAGNLTARLSHIETDVSQTRGLLVQTAVDGNRLSRVEEDVRLLRRGVGFIRDTDAQTVDREYKD